MSKRKALGSGLDVLLGNQNKSASTNKEKTPAEDFAGKKISVLGIEKITRNPRQPRKIFLNDSLEPLANSIREKGQITPILVRAKGQGYELVAGERRWRAIQSLKQDTIEAIIIDVSDEDSAVLAIVENVQREQLNIIEEAEALQKLYSDFSMTHEHIAKFTGKSRSHVTNIMRLNDLSEYVKNMINQRKIEMGHGRAVLVLDLDKQDALVKKVIKNNLSVRMTEKMVKDATAGAKKGGEVTTSADTIALERELSEILGADLTINHTASGKGKILIKYNSLDELEGMIKKFKK